MTPQVLNMSTITYGFGDNTAGPIWKNSMPGQPILGGFEDKTNYPFGESIYSPQGYSLVLQTAPIWALSEAFGPVAGYNLFNIIGFISAALVMCGFVYTLTRNKYIAILAGYAASFAPYYQMKVGGHPGYGYQALLIGVLWAFFNLIKHVKKKDAVTLGVLTAICFYFDPYFSLLAATCLAALGLSWGILSWIQVRRGFIKRVTVLHQLRMLGLSALVTMVLLIPLVAVAVSKSDEISSSVAAARGNVLLEAKACSVLPHQYATPFVLNPIFNKLFGATYKTNVDNINNHFTCGIGEGTIGISIAMLGMVGMTLVIFGWEKLNNRKLGLSRTIAFEPRLLVFSIIALGFVAMLMALPPARLLNIVPTPSDALLSITSTWRTLARFYVLINISVVILFSVSLAYFAQHFKRHKKILAALLMILFFIIFVEYQAFKPFAGNKLSNYDYTSSPPAAYFWLKSQVDIKDIAEYPLERAGGESNAQAYYQSMQTTHGKNLFNSALSNSPQENIRSSLKDLSDPQTIQVLRSLGIDAVVIHGVPSERIDRIPHLQVIYSAPQSAYNLLTYTPLVTDDNIVIAKIVDTPTATTMLRLRENEFPRNVRIIHSSIDWSYEALQNSHIDIAPIRPDTKPSSSQSSQEVCFSVRLSMPKDIDKLTILADGKPQSTILITDKYQAVQASARSSVTLRNKHGHNMQVKDLGCSQNIITRSPAA